MTVELVRNGEAVMKTGAENIGEMLIQIGLDYPGIKDVRSLEFHEIYFFYSGLKPTLIKATKPK